MDQETRNKLQRATQQLRRLLEDEFAQQFQGTFDILPGGKILNTSGKHLNARQRLVRQKLLESIEHIEACGKDTKGAVEEYTREAAFTFLNRFVALKMLEARGMVQECVSKGDASSGFREFCGLTPGLSMLGDGGYRLYLECLLDELSVEVKVLFDRCDSASLLWPRRGALKELLDILDQVDLMGVWGEDETIGWIYQYFNSRDEINEMREGSRMARNSRELAVRNQFFTPRYVVEFLTDNTLGRIWYEMRKGETRLVRECKYLDRRPTEVFLAEGHEPPSEDVEAKQDPTQEDLLKELVHIRHRAKKDPRDLRVLDPACGSGHFLLYSFDLLISIYDEAWHDEASERSEVTGKRLRDDYPDLEQLHAALPGLVISHNLHGIDIDPRAAQIATLALWMRGHRAFNDFEISRERRTPIARSNIVCAELMPGELTFLDEFIIEHLSSNAEGRFLASLVRKVFESMKLAGEAGSLLKIEEDIAEEVAKAKNQWVERPEYKQQSLFDHGPRGVQREFELSLAIADEAFWGGAEQRIYDSLRAYSKEVERSGGYQRRLFAADAARGFAFIDICRRRYDVILMNPPFGETTELTKTSLQKTYIAAKHDIATSFIERGIDLLESNGTLGVISSRTIFFTSYTSTWREDFLLGKTKVCEFVDLGADILDATVETAMYTLAPGRKQPNTSSLFIKASTADNRATFVQEAIKEHATGAVPSNVFLCDTSTFSRVARSPFAYWVPDKIRTLFSRLPSFATRDRHGHIGALSQDDFRFVRLWWEVPPEAIGDDWTSGTDKKWVPYVKGGTLAPYFMDLAALLKWENDGSELKEFVMAYRRRKGFADHWTGQLNSYEFYFREGVSWSNRPGKQGSFWVLPKGVIFRHSAPGLMDENEDALLFDLSILNSRPYRFLLDLLMPRGSSGSGTLKYDLGYVRSVPIPSPNVAVRGVLTSCANECIRPLLDAYSNYEGSHYFLYPVTFEEESIETTLARIKSMDAKRRVAVSEAASQIDGIATSLYEMDDETCEQLFAESNVRPVSEFIHSHEVWKGKNDAVNVRAIISYCVGVVLRRWDVRFALGVKAPPIATPCFASYPNQAIGTLLDGDELSEDYPFPSLEGGVLVLDAGHARDMQNRVEYVFEVIFGPHAADAIAKASDFVKCRDLGEYFRKAFFDDHCQTYSKSKRRAPVYWQLGMASASYSIWVYYHRVTKDTFFQVLNEYVKPKLNHERQKLERVRNEAGMEPTRSQRKDIEEQEKFVAEVAAMAEEVERIAPLWNPNLNDGVIINFAPLWRLVPQNKAWQKECKSCWDKLVKGEYDWAHLAMHLWPERVVPKCVTDASLAIAHGLEEVFWEQDDRERFQPKEEPDGGWEPVIERLVKERSSPAVKAALQSLLDAPVPSASSGRSKRRRAGS